MQRKNKSGFTLIELLVVVLIIGILSAIALPQYSMAVEKSRATEALALMNAVAGSAERYRFQKEAWPTSLSQLDIEVPTIASKTSGLYGGKNFQIEIFPAGDVFEVVATRRVKNDSYVLTTYMQDLSENETITRLRKCTSTTDKGTAYCDAITNGHNNDF